MRKVVVLLIVMFGFLAARSTESQIAPLNEAGAAIAHVNFLAHDIEGARRFWVELGGVPASHVNLEWARFPGILIFVRQTDPTAGAAGSVIDHIAFDVADIQRSMEQWKAKGLKVDFSANAHQGWGTTPDGLVRIEIIEKKSLPVPIAFDYLYFRVADKGVGGKSTISEMQAWYAKLFGAKPGKHGNVASVSLPGGDILFAKSDTPTTPTEGRALDHYGFEIRNLEGFYSRAEASGVKFDRPFTKRPEMGETLTVLTDPSGARIELNDGVAQW